MTTLEKLSILKAWAEVYIFVMIENASAPANILQKKLLCTTQNNIPLNVYNHLEKYGEVDDSEKKLLSLVEPELQSLSKHWLDALKDHALLRLPCEFQSQLPQDGGAFFTTETINSSKSHYLSSWPPILYAASLWLNSGGFETTISNQILDEINKNHVSTSASTNLTENRFYMILGICIEALCSARTSEKSKNVLSSLQSLYTLFSCHWSEKILAKNKCLAVELCNVLHRQILIRDDIHIQLLCIEILRQTITASFVRLGKEENIDQTLFGEGGASGEIIPGKSIVYSVLEVCLCIFVRYIPSMNSSISSTNEIYQKSSILNDDNCMLISSGLQCTESLLYICSPKGAVSILSTILYMTTMIINELARKTIKDSLAIADSIAVKSALQCLKSVCIHKYAEDEKSSKAWKQLIQSSLATIIDMSRTGDKMDEVTMLLAMSVYILNTGDNVVTIPSLQYPCINHFIQCLQSDSKFVKIKCVQTIKLIFLNCDLKVSTPYIHALAPRIIEMLYSSETKYPRDEIDVSCILESIAVIETLISLAEPENRKLFYVRFK